MTATQKSAGPVCHYHVALKGGVHHSDNVMYELMKDGLVERLKFTLSRKEPVTKILIPVGAAVVVDSINFDGRGREVNRTTQRFVAPTLSKWLLRRARRWHSN